MKITRETFLSYGIVLGLCIVISMVCFLYKRKNKWCSFFLNGILSISGLYGIKEILEYFQYQEFGMEITPVSLGICLVLGIPGLMLLYAILIFIILF